MITSIEHYKNCVASNGANQRMKIKFAAFSIYMKNQLPKMTLELCFAILIWVKVCCVFFLFTIHNQMLRALFHLFFIPVYLHYTRAVHRIWIEPIRNDQVKQVEQIHWTPLLQIRLFSTHTHTRMSYTFLFDGWSHTNTSLFCGFCCCYSYFVFSSHLIGYYSRVCNAYLIRVQSDSLAHNFIYIIRFN